MPQLDVKRMASELLQKGRLSEAIGAYKSLLEQSKRPNPAIVNLIGDIYVKQGDHENGFAHFLQACKQYADEGLFHNGIAVGKKILRLDKDQVEVYGTLGDLYARQGLGMDAVKFLTEYARRKEETNEFPAALAALGQACETLGDCPEVFIAYGEKLEHVERHEDAADNYRKAAEVYAMRGMTAETERWRSRAKNLLGDEPVDDAKLEPAGADESNVWDMMSLRDLTSNPPAEPADAGAEPAAREDVTEPAEPPSRAARPGRPGSGVRARSEWGVFDPGKNPAIAPPPPLPGAGLSEPAEPVTAATPPDLPSRLSASPPPAPAPPDVAGPPSSLPPVFRPQPPVAAAPPVVPPPVSPPEPPPVVGPPDLVSLELEAPFISEEPSPQPAAAREELTLEPESALGGGLELDLPPAPPMTPANEIGHGETGLAEIGVEEAGVHENILEESGPGAEQTLVAPERSPNPALSELPGIIMPPTANAPVAPRARPSDQSTPPPPPPPTEIPTDEPSAPDAARTDLLGMPPVAAVTGFSGFFPRPEIPQPEPEPELPELPELTEQGREPAIVIGDDTELVREGGDVNEVIKDFREATSQILDPDDHRAHYDLGTTYLEMELFDEATAEFALAAEGVEFALLSREMMGYCFLRQGLIDHAIAELKKGLAIPDREERERLGLLYNLGIACSVLDRTTEAIDAFQRILDLEPGFRDTRNRLDRLGTHGH